MRNHVFTGTGSNSNSNLSGDWVTTPKKYMCGKIKTNYINDNK